MTGVGVKVTEVPAQISLADGETETLTGITGFTVIVKVLDVAGFPEMQEALDVSMHETASLLTGAEE